MDTKALRQKILDLAIRGKLVPQDPNDEPASVLLEKIREEKQKMVQEGKLKPKDIKNDTIIFKGDDNLHYEKFQDGTVKCIEDEIPFEIPDGWAWCRLNGIYNFIDYRGATPTKTPEGVPLITAKNVKSGYIDYSIDEYISDEEYYNRQQRGVSHKGDILFTTEAPLGNAALADIEKYSAGQRLITLQNYNSDRITLDNALFVYFILSNFFQNELHKKKTGTTVAGIKAAILKTLWIPIPPYNEQSRISKEIDKYIHNIDEISDNANLLTTKVSAIKSKMLDLAIQGKLVPQNPSDEPASVLLDRIRAEKEELIKQGKLKRDKKESIIFRGVDNSYYEEFQDGTRKVIDDEIPFDLPKGWCWLRGRSILKSMGRRLPEGDYFDYIDIDSVDNKDNIVKSPKHLLVKDAPSRASRAVYNGSVVFSMVRPYLRNIAYIDDSLKECVASTGFYICTSNGMLYSKYMFLLLVSDYVVNGLNQYMKGDNSPSINKENIENWLFPVPPYSYQIRVSSRIEKLIEKLKEVETNLV